MKADRSTTRIVHLTSRHRPEDVRIFRKECRSLAAAGYEVHLVAPNAIEHVEDGVAVHGFVWPDGVRPLRIARRLWRAWHAARMLRPALCHFHEPELVPVALLLRLGGVRIVYDVHEDHVSTLEYGAYKLGKRTGFRLLEPLARRVCDRFVAATPSIARRLPPERTITVANYPLSAEFAGAQSVERSRGDVVYVGGISPARGIREMVEAAALLDAPDARLVLIGTFSPPEVEQEMRALPGWARVEFLGWLGRPEVVEQLRTARAGILLFHPLHNHVEALPNKLFEYMAAGLPVIASDFPYWRKLLDPLGCALFVNPLDPTGIAAAIEELLADDARATEMGRRGAAAVRTHLNWENEAPRLVELYRSLGISAD